MFLWIHSQKLIILSFNIIRRRNFKFTNYFTVSLSSRDHYNVLLIDSNDAFFSSNDGNFYIEFIFKYPKNLTGFEIETGNYDILKSYDIIINDGPVFKSITDDISLRDNQVQ